MKKGKHLCTLVGMQIVTATMENSMEFPQKVKNDPYNPVIALPGIYPKNIKTLIQRNTCTFMFIEALFTIANYGSSTSILHQHMNGSRRFCIYTQWNIMQP